MPDEITPSSDFFTDVRGILADARRAAYTAVNSAMVAAYWQIGRRIVEEEQGGSAKSTYGERLLPELSRALTAEFGKGFSYANLRNFRQFYLTYPDPEICYALRSKLSWTHHRLIMRVESSSAREYYITHAEQENWSTRTLERQIETRTYHRLLSSQDTTSSPATLPAQLSIRDFIKDPYVLEFLGLPEDPAASETEVESAIIFFRPQRQRTTLRLQIPHRPPHRGRTHRRTRTRTPRHRTQTERRGPMTHSKSKIQNPKFSVSSEFLGDLCGLAVQTSSLSLNRRIPNGSWCLFREPFPGSRNGKVVIVQSRDIQDPDTGGKYTVKIYRSDKTETEDSWAHQRIRLEPDLITFRFKPITLKPYAANDLRVIGEFDGIIS